MWRSEATPSRPREIPAVLPLPSATRRLHGDRRTAPAPTARKLAESPPSDNCRVPFSSFVGGSAERKARPDPRQQLVAHRAVRIEPLLAAAFDRGRIGGGPILDVGG